MSNEDKLLNLAYQGLEIIPKALISSYGNSANILDVSHNKIRDVRFLEHFTSINTLILDHNLLGGDVLFPHLPTLKVLWLNHNNITCLEPFIARLNESFPNLQHLSLMGNAIVPPCQEDTFYDYVQYRLYVISYFQTLEHLDDRNVTDHEKEEAVRLYRKPFIDTYPLTEFIQSTLSSVKELWSKATTPEEVSINRPERSNVI